MARNLLPLVCALVLMSVGSSKATAAAQAVSGTLQPQAQTQSSALVGNWSANVNFGAPGGLLITNSFTADGRMQSAVSTVVRGLTISYMLTGVYQFNAATGTLSYTWKDFSPKQTCIGGACTPVQPPAVMGVVTTSTIHFLSSTQFVATSNGAATTYVRTNTAGFPTP